MAPHSIFDLNPTNNHTTSTRAQTNTHQSLRSTEKGTSVVPIHPSLMTPVVSCPATPNDVMKKTKAKFGKRYKHKDRHDRHQSTVQTCRRCPEARK
jgi:hypothetical protein